MRPLVLVTALVCAGCGWYPFPFSAPRSGRAGCLTVTSDAELDQVALEQDVELARSELDRRGIVAAADYCEAFADVPIAVRGRETLGEALGDYSRLSGIELSRDGTALLHEQLHALDVAHLRLLTFEHAGWGTRGYFAADNEFTLCAVNLWTGQLNAPAESCAYARLQEH